VKVPKHLHSVDGWALERAETADGISTLRYTRPEFSDVAIIVYPQGPMPSEAYVRKGLLGLAARAPEGIRTGYISEATA